jgi:hypothetical protein
MEYIVQIMKDEETKTSEGMNRVDWRAATDPSLDC